MTSNRCAVARQSPSRLGFRQSVVDLQRIGLRAPTRTGSALAGKAVIVRIPATGRELDQNLWMVKQVLDVGAHGIIFPTVETPEQALMAIRAMRYPQRLGAPDQEPAGLRGTSPRLAARYWGLSVPDWGSGPLGDRLARPGNGPPRVLPRRCRVPNGYSPCTTGPQA